MGGDVNDGALIGRFQTLDLTRAQEKLPFSYRRPQRTHLVELEVQIRFLQYPGWSSSGFWIKVDLDPPVEVPEKEVGGITGGMIVRYWRHVRQGEVLAPTWGVRRKGDDSGQAL
ncbi:unnamed protein product [Lupinus luteus]|uniref:Uncharacterized protein n=1 Tax=Lupinus luteus TaxID=3873 RepID=A0AAV1XWS2_LUPLU